METVVITGAGGMGKACARRLGAGRSIVLGDASVTSLEIASHELKAEGHCVHTCALDVSSAESVESFARFAESKGQLRALVHTAGISPVMAGPDKIYEVDLLGTALVLDAFLPLTMPGTVGVMIASMAGYTVSLSADDERAFSTGPTASLLDVAHKLGAKDSSAAYRIAKRANQLRVQYAALEWSARGARLVSVSPGVTATPMASKELESAAIPDLVKKAAIKRTGTPTDIAAAVEWLISPAASYITGIDLLVDGGVTAARRWC